MGIDHPLHRAVHEQRHQQGRDRCSLPARLGQRQDLIAEPQLKAAILERPDLFHAVEIADDERYDARSVEPDRMQHGAVDIDQLGFGARRDDDGVHRHVLSEHLFDMRLRVGAALGQRVDDDENALLHLTKAAELSLTMPNPAKQFEHVAGQEIPTSGPVAQCSEHAADNRLVGSSSPPSPTTQSYANRDFPARCE